MVQTLFGPADNKPGLFDRLKKAVASTKEQLVGQIEQIVEGKENIDRSVLDDLEATLIVADLGVTTTKEILARLQEQIKRRTLLTTKQLRPAIEQEILRILENPAGSQDKSGRAHLPKHPPAGQPEVIFVVGVNGVGKTTSIAKLANYFLQQGR